VDEPPVPPDLPPVDEPPLPELPLDAAPPAPPGFALPLSEFGMHETAPVNMLATKITTRFNRFSFVMAAPLR
jgi:hypothetical protein